ncbi:transcriptional regulator, ArsR family [Thermobaculum terrenum ATCC BAA-798]|uniref:Transcriptional regulator, ArsR family n=1 Tax=Thermobaculum terrenum (strain ATCC BAA-798 / CCMEE 7001 / YNP1) TaxID=525904 RepID=D1CJ17_THET1|nr:autorepressor SdpR family transcription factor [Thermobaculum terrenum]ACZ43737.1 transcriptional regulator, ArsR family [Thermobaculum terrenum ATCC BAA-798]
MPIDAVFKALADPTRREILRLLGQRDMTAGEIAAAFDRSPSTISEHLGVLRDAGLVVTERSGTSIVYSLNTAAHEELLAAVMRLLHIGEQVEESRDGSTP